MPIYATAEAKEFWQKCHSRSRSLAASHFITLAESKNDNQWRKQSCDAIRSGKSIATKAAAYTNFAATLHEGRGTSVFAKLEARLIIDSAGGVLENGGICLDRTSGIPFIPGSTAKGAARRYAIHQLSETQDPKKKATLLAKICRIFGYGDQEWKAGRSENEQPISDFWLAMVPLFDARKEQVEARKEQDKKRDEIWKIVSKNTAEILIARYGWRINPEKPLLKHLPKLAGSVCFLPAFPESDPGIDVDVLTCHHPDYYSGKNRTVATDDEDPNPVIFPTVAQGTPFSFPIALNGSLHRSGDEDLAKNWLMKALQIYGLGAKTNAGYGWFSIDQKAEQERLEEAKAVKKKAEELKAKEKMSPSDRARYELEKLDQKKFAERVRDLSEFPEEEQKAICELLIGSKSGQWANWKKPKAEKWQPRLPGIREIATTHGIELP